MTTVSLVEDDASFCALLTRNLSASKRIKIVSTHVTGEEALREVPRLRPDVILMDIKLPGMNGIECLRRLRGLNPPLFAHVLVLTDYEDSELVFDALRAGASGYLLKDRIAAKEILAAIKNVIAGGAVMSPIIARKVIRHFEYSASALSTLSKRQSEVLHLLAEGLPYKQIADRLGISMDGVRSHIGCIPSSMFALEGKRPAIICSTRRDHTKTTQSRSCRSTENGTPLRR